MIFNLFKRKKKQSTNLVNRGPKYIFHIKRSFTEGRVPTEIGNRELMVNYFDKILFVGIGDNKYETIDLKKLPDSFTRTLQEGIVVVRK